MLFFGGGAGGVFLKIYLDHKLKIERSEISEKRLQFQKQREASTAVAEILSSWVRPNYHQGLMTNVQRWEIQTTYWKNILLLDNTLHTALCRVFQKEQHNLTLPPLNTDRHRRPQPYLHLPHPKAFPLPTDTLIPATQFPSAFHPPAKSFSKKH